MLNPHLIMLCLNVGAQINLEIVNYFVDWLAACSSVTMEYNFWRVLWQHQVINYFKVNLSIQIQAVHVKIRISLFGSYLRQLFMDFAPIWLIVKPVIIPIIGLVGSARTAVLRLKSSKDRALRNTSFLQSLAQSLRGCRKATQICRYHLQQQWNYLSYT